MPPAALLGPYHQAGFVPPAQIRRLQDYLRLRADHLTSAAASVPRTVVSVSRPASRPGVNEDDAFASEQKLKIANMYLKNGLKEKAKVVLMEIIQKYPNTPAGQEAAKALLQLR